MSSDASYTRCDMGLFDFFRRSSSRSRSKTTTNTTTNTTVTTQTTMNQSSTHDNNSTTVMTETVSVSVKEPVYPQRASMPDAHKFQSMASASTVSTESNNDSSEFGDDDEPQRQSESLGSINNYEIVRELGRGATAVVQLGKQKNGDRLVALKVFKTSLLKKMREVKRVGRRMVVSTALDKVQIEIAIMKKFQHKNLLNLLEVFDDDSETLVLMLEYAPHGQIMEWNATERVYRANPKVVGDRGVFDEDSLRGCVRQLLLGLEYLHENSICHRDLKPENILLGEDGVYKIADFGVAHLFEEEKKETDAAATPATSEASTPAKKKGIVASTAGTYAFMAPETLKGKEYSAYDADIWALGITIHALALGKIPYYHIDVVELFEMIENQPLDLGDADNNNNSPLSEGLTSLLRGMLEKDPESRWSIKQCKQSPWLLEGLDDAAKEAFLNPSHEQVQVNPEDVAKAVTKVTSMNVLLRVQLGANKWKRKAMASLEMKKRASLSAAPTIDEEASDRMSVASSYSDRPSFVLTKTPSGEELQGNQQEA